MSKQFEQALEKIGRYVTDEIGPGIDGVPSEPHKLYQALLCATTMGAVVQMMKLSDHEQLRLRHETAELITALLYPGFIQDYRLKTARLYDARRRQGGKEGQTR